MKHILFGHHWIQDDFTVVTVIEHPLQSLGVIVKMEHAVKNGFYGTAPPQLKNIAQDGVDVLVLTLEVQKMAKIETTDGLVILVEFQR